MNIRIVNIAIELEPVEEQELEPVEEQELELVEEQELEVNKN